MEHARHPFISRLKNPACFPHECCEIEVVETHISWVLLTGDHAYKIKKPVNLGFVDFSSLERRRHYCEEELRLNRRLAPDLYLSVVPITGSPEHPIVGGSGSAFEYTVCMRQFDQNSLLSRIDLSRLPHTVIDDLADQCAEFHEMAAVAPSELNAGTSERFRRAVQHCLSVVADATDTGAATARELQSWIDREFMTVQSMFDIRCAAQMIRECHGDLHLGNMFYTDTGITIFDGIEFNEHLRWIDIMSDIAFAVMDFEAYGVPGIGRRLLNRWLEQTGDYSGLRLLPIYRVYRALVRAKVAAIRQRQSNLKAVSPRPRGSFEGNDSKPGSQVPVTTRLEAKGDYAADADSQRLSAEYSCYLSLAKHYTRSRQPALIITSGPSGSGKTTATQQLIDSANVLRVRSDVERKRMHGLRPEQSTTPMSELDVYSPESTAATYDRLAIAARQIVEAGFNAVVDATFLKHSDRDRFRRLAAELNAQFYILRCDAHDDLLRSRIAYRHLHQQDASEADVKVMEAQLENREPLTAAEISCVINNTDRDLATLCRSLE